jgi:hypothetical protein
MYLTTHITLHNLACKYPSYKGRARPTNTRV